MSRSTISLIQRTRCSLLPRVDRVDHEPGKEEVVDGVIPLRQLLVNRCAVFGVDLGEEDQPVVVGDRAKPVEVVPRPGPVEEVDPADLLVEVSEGVEPQDLGAERRQLVERLAVEVPDRLGPCVEVHLTEIGSLAVDDVDLLVEGVPVEAIGAVGEANLEDGQTGFAHEQLVEVLGRRDHVAVIVEFAFALPELVPVDEEVGELGVVTVRQHVLELWRSHREMVEHEVELQQDAELVEGLEIGCRREVLRSGRSR